MTAQQQYDSLGSKQRRNVLLKNWRNSGDTRPQDDSPARGIPAGANGSLIFAARPDALLVMVMHRNA